MIKNGRTDSNEFTKLDNRDRLEEFNYGQQVKKCNYLSDIIILNENNFSNADTQGKDNFILLFACLKLDFNILKFDENV